MSVPGYTIRPVQSSDIPALSDLLYESKLNLTINRLLFKDWPNEAVQRRNYAAIFESLDRSKTEFVSVVDDGTGEVVGHFALTRRRPTPSTETQSIPSGQEQEVPDFFNGEVLAAVGAAVTELTQDTKDIDHYGKHLHSIYMRKEANQSGTRLQSWRTSLSTPHTVIAA